MKLSHLTEKIVLYLMTVSIFKLEFALSQESSAAVQRKEYLWDHIERSLGHRNLPFFTSIG